MEKETSGVSELGNENKEKNEFLLLALVEKIGTVGTIVSDLLADLPILGKYYKQTKGDSNQNVFFKSRKAISEKSEEVIFTNQNNEEIKLIITIPQEVLPEELEKWKTFGKLPSKYSANVNSFGKIIYLQVFRDNTGKLRVSSSPQQEPSVIEHITGFFEVAEKLLKNSFNNMPLSEKNPKILDSDSGVFALYPNGGVIVNTKNAV